MASDESEASSHESEASSHEPEASSHESEIESYLADAYEESVGVILFKPSTDEVCILHSTEHDEHFLPQGRRRESETRSSAAIRIATESTGFPCFIVSLNMDSRVSRGPEDETGDLSSESNYLINTTEPIKLQLQRHESGVMKLVWWFVAALDEEDELASRLEDEFGMDPGTLLCDQSTAIKKLGTLD
ncbi:hypothetical protein GGR57DRAFT_506122 [Xylariaceae sp. FL1272]|nr:hypothetical protein GGR57DRAFT_506122 [Xylariaceae sp. FL1272]